MYTNHPHPRNVPIPYLYISLCVCNCPPFRGVCPNYEVMEFQPWKVTSQNLGYVDMLNTLFYPACPTCTRRFWIFLDYTLHPTTPP